MDLEIKIVELASGDWQEFKKLRLRALKEESEAFEFKKVALLEKELNVQVNLVRSY